VGVSQAVELRVDAHVLEVLAALEANGGLAFSHAVPAHNVGLLARAT
jgi:hypothetical protein